jgi:hypothetical protein
LKKDLSVKETAALRVLYWEVQEKQNAFQDALNEVAKMHGINLSLEQWNATTDFRSLVKAGR